MRGWFPDLLKIALGGIVGVIGKRVADNQKVRVMRRGIYKELAYNYRTLYWFTRQSLGAGKNDMQQAMLRSMLRFDYYEHAKSDKTTFAELKESYVIDAIYSHLKYLVTMVVGAYAPYAVWGTARAALNRLRHCVKNGEIDGKLLGRMGPKDSKEAVKALLASPDDDLSPKDELPPNY